MPRPSPSWNRHSTTSSARHVPPTRRGRAAAPRTPTPPSTPSGDDAGSLSEHAGSHSDASTASHVYSSAAGSHDTSAQGPFAAAPTSAPGTTVAPASDLDDAYLRYCLPRSTGSPSFGGTNDNTDRMRRMTDVDTTTPPANRRRRRLSLWKIRDWNILYRGMLISTAGSFMTSALLPGLATTLAGDSATLAGAATGSLMVMAVALMLPAGALVDRWNRKHVLTISSFLQFLTYTVMSVLLLTGTLTIWWLIGLLLVAGGCATFTNVVVGTATRAVVPTTLMAEARIATSMQFETGKAIGPVIGTALFRLGHAVPFVVDALSYLFVSINTLFLRSSLNTSTASSTPKLTIGQQIREGFSYIWQRPFMRFYTWLLSVYALLTYAVPFLLAQHLKDQGVGTDLLGLIFPGMAVATLLTTSILKGLMARFTVHALASLGFGGAAAALFGMASSNSVVTLGLFAAVFSASSSLATNPLTAYFLSRVPVESAGSVMSAQTFVQWLPMPVSALVMGRMIDASSVSLTSTVLALGVGALAAALALSPSVRAIPSQQKW